MAGRRLPDGMEAEKDVPVGHESEPHLSSGGMVWGGPGADAAPDEVTVDAGAEPPAEPKGGVAPPERAPEPAADPEQRE